MVQPDKDPELSQWLGFAAVAQVGFLAQELPHGMGVAKKKKKPKQTNKQKKHTHKNFLMRLEMR